MFGVRSLLWLLSAVNEVKTSRREQSRGNTEREKKQRQKKRLLAEMLNILYICL